MQPRDPVQVPRRQGVDPVLVWPVTMGHVKRVGIPFLLSIPVAKLMPIGSPMLVVSGVGAVSLVLAFLQIGGVPFTRWLRNRIHNARPRPALPQVDHDCLVMPAGRGLVDYSVLARLEAPTYHLLDEASQASLLSSLRHVWAGLETRLQIVATTRPSNPVPHLRSLAGNADSVQARRQLRSYAAWLERFLRQNNVQDRELYAVLTLRAPECQGPRPAELENRIQGLHAAAHALIQALRNNHGDGTILEAHQALTLVKRCLRCPDYPTWSLAQHAITNEPPPGSKAGPVAINRDRIHDGENHTRVLTLKAYPDALPVAWLDSVLALQERITASIHVEPKPAWLVRRHLVRSRNDLAYKVRKKSRAGADVTEELQILDSLEDQLERVTAGQARFHEVTILVQIVSSSHRGLDRLTAEVQQHLRNKGIDAFAEPWSQDEARTSCLPLGVNRLRMHSQTMDDASLTAIQPFLYGSIRHPHGTLVGFHAQNGSPLHVDAWQIVPHNRIVAGISGAGKSYNVKLDLLRTRMMRPEFTAFVIDPLREFRDAVLALGGQNVLIGNPENIINPLQLHADASRDALEAKMDFLEAFFALVVPGTSHYERSVLHSRTRRLYHASGITKDPASHALPPPTLSDLLEYLQVPTDEDRQVQAACRSLVVHLEPRINGPLRCMDGQTNVQLDASLVNFDLHDMDRSWQALHMFVVLDYIQSRLTQDLATPKMVYIDEAWKLLDYEETARTLNHLSRHVRHYHAGLTLITQTPESLLKSDDGRAFLQNCQQTVLFRQRNVPKDVRQAYGLDAEDAQLLTRIGKAEHMDHSEAMYIIGDQKLLVACIASPLEHQLITTRPDELAKRGAP